MNFLFYAPQMGPYGGIERHVCTLAAILANKGHRVCFLTTSNSLGNELRADLKHENIEFLELPISRGKASAWKKLCWLLWKSTLLRFRTWDLIYTNGQSALARYVWRAAGKKTRILHHHHTSAAADEQLSWSAAFKRVLTEAPEVVTCSEFTRKCIEQSTGRAHTTFLPYLTQSPITAEEVQDHPVSGKLHFGFLGRLIPEKGIGRIMELSLEPSLANIEWHIHGSGPDYPPEAFTPYPNIHYHGPYRTPAEHAVALRALDALVLFSTHNEGMPLCLIEGMSAGLPWIATDRGGTAELALSKENSRVLDAQASIAEMRDACSSLASDITAGRCSRINQRKAYDSFIAPETVSRVWLKELKA